MRRIVIAVIVAVLLGATTTAAASTLSIAGPTVPRFGVTTAAQCHLTGVEIVADYYVVEPNKGYYSGFRVRAMGSLTGCDDFTVYARVLHGTAYYYLKIDAVEVPVDGTSWVACGVFEADPGEPLVYSTSDYSPQHIVSSNPLMDHSIFDETLVLVANEPPGEF